MRLLVIDDDFLILRSIENVIRARRPDWDVDVFQGPIDIGAKLPANQYDVILSDIKMPLLDGLSVLRQARILSPTTPLVFLTGQRAQYETAALDLGAFAVLDKPIAVDTLLNVLDAAHCSARGPSQS